MSIPYMRHSVSYGKHEGKDKLRTTLTALATALATWLDDPDHVAEPGDRWGSMWPAHIENPTSRATHDSAASALLSLGCNDSDLVSAPNQINEIHSGRS